MESHQVFVGHDPQSERQHVAQGLAMLRRVRLEEERVGIGHDMLWQKVEGRQIAETRPPAEAFVLLRIERQIGQAGIDVEQRFKTRDVGVRRRAHGQGLLHLRPLLQPYLLGHLTRRRLRAGDPHKAGVGFDG